MRYCNGYSLSGHKLYPMFMKSLIRTNITVLPCQRGDLISAMPVMVLLSIKVKENLTIRHLTLNLIKH